MILFGKSFAECADAATTNRYALNTNNSGVTGLDTSDPLGLGARRIQFSNNTTTGAGRWATFPLTTTLPTEWCAHFYFVQTITEILGTSTFDRIALAPTNSSGTISGVNIICRYSNGNPGNKFICVRIGGSIVYSFPDFSAAVQSHYMVYVLEHATTGIIRIYRDDILEMELTNQNTSRGANVFDRIRLGANTLNNGGAAIFCHVILTDGEELGRFAGCSRHAVNADIGPNEWTPSAGVSHFGVIDEFPHNSDTDYLRSTAAGVGERTRHTFSVSLPSRRILGVRAIPTWRLEAAGTDTLGILYDTGTNTVQESTTTTETSHTPTESDWVEQNPDTSQEWTVSELNTLEVEVEHGAP